MEEKTSTKATGANKEMTHQEAINEGIKLGQALAGTDEVQARREELNLTDELAETFWWAFHNERALTYKRG